jgi:magnesium and cobalt transporter
MALGTDGKQQIGSVFERLKSYLTDAKKKNAMSEIQEIIDEVEEKGIIDENQSDMIENIIVLKDTMAREIMVPKMDMVLVESSRPVTDVVSAITGSGHSTIPVYENTTDNIIGVVHAKDILVHFDQCLEGMSIREIMRQPFFVPEGKKLNDLLKDFKERRIKVAIVIDEYGSVDGMTTLEDVMNEIVETDIDDDEVQDKGDGTFAVDPRMSIDEFTDEFDVDIPDGDYDTVGGFITSKLERIPRPGETFEFEGLSFEIVEASKKRISKLTVRKNQEKKD